MTENTKEKIEQIEKALNDVSDEEIAEKSFKALIPLYRTERYYVNSNSDKLDKWNVLSLIRDYRSAKSEEHRIRLYHQIIARINTVLSNYSYCEKDHDDTNEASSGVAKPLSDAINSLLNSVSHKTITDIVKEKEKRRAKTAKDKLYDKTKEHVAHAYVATTDKAHSLYSKYQPEATDVVKRNADLLVKTAKGFVRDFKEVNGKKPNDK